LVAVVTVLAAIVLYALVWWVLGVSDEDEAVFGAAAQPVAVCARSSRSLTPSRV